MNNLTLLKILEWLAKEQTGLSSEFMAFTAAGVETRRYAHHPHDPADFNRCLVLLDYVPEIKNHFDIIASKSPEWKASIDNWELIEATFIDEVGFNWCKGSCAPKTYTLMKRIIRAVHKEGKQ